MEVIFYIFFLPSNITWYNVLIYKRGAKIYELAIVFMILYPLLQLYGRHLETTLFRQKGKPWNFQFTEGERTCISLHRWTLTYESTWFCEPTQSKSGLWSVKTQEKCVIYQLFITEPPSEPPSAKFCSAYFLISTLTTWAIVSWLPSRVVWNKNPRLL